MNSAQNNGRIAKNTLVLYVRLFLGMLVSLYTTRILIQELGIDDFGVFSAVASLVILVSFMNSAVSSASQRFLSFAIGRCDPLYLRQTFSIILNVHFLIVFTLVVLAETVGLWFLNVYMSIPPSRVAAANWVYQFSILSFIVVIIAAPYMAIILAREKMITFSLISLIELLLKLFIAYMIIFSEDDKLKSYALLLFIATAVCNVVYIIYSMRNFPECEYSGFWSWISAKEIIQYSGWNAIGSIAILFRMQGTNILLNVFFGPILSAAQAVSTQIQGAMSSLLASTYTATRPQIIKYYASGNFSDMWRLVFDSTRVSYYLLFLVVAPFFFESDYILSLWLKDVPSHASGIVRLMLIVILLEAISNQLVAVLQAANKIKRFQISSVAILLLNLPIAYIVLLSGAGVYAPFFVSIGITLFYIFTQVLITKKEVGLPIKIYTCEILRVLLVTALVMLILWGANNAYAPGLIRFVATFLASFFFGALFIWIFGLSAAERRAIFGWIRGRFEY